MVPRTLRVHPAYPASASFFREPRDHGTWETFVVIGEHTETVQAVAPPPYVELRCGLYEYWCTLKTLVLVGVGVIRPDHIYQLWLDPAPDRDQRQFIEDLITQASLRIDFYGRGGHLVRSDTVVNTIRDPMRDALALLSQRAPGTRAADGLAPVDRRYVFQSGWELWHELAPAATPRWAIYLNCDAAAQIPPS